MQRWGPMATPTELDTGRVRSTHQHFSKLPKDSWDWDSLLWTDKPKWFFVVVQLLSHLQLCDPMDCSMPGFPVLHYPQSLLKFMSIDLVVLSNHLILCHPFSFCLQSFPASGSFPVSRLFASGSQSFGTLALASVLPKNIQIWFPLGLTGLIL